MFTHLFLILLFHLLFVNSEYIMPSLSSMFCLFNFGMVNLRLHELNYTLILYHGLYTFLQTDISKIACPFFLLILCMFC